MIWPVWITSERLATAARILMISISFVIAPIRGIWLFIVHFSPNWVHRLLEKLLPRSGLQNA